LTGTGQVDLQTLNFWGTTTNVGQAVSSLSTYGSNGHGDFVCGGGGQFNFVSSTDYYYVGANCNDDGHMLYSMP
jgi:hypothetical protein